MDQALVEQIVASVLAQLQPAPVRPVVQAHKPETKSIPASTELNATVITAKVLESSVRAGTAVQIGRKSILTPAAQDWLRDKKISWTRSNSFEKSAGGAESKSARWQLIVQTVTSNVSSIQDLLKRQPDGWTTELVGSAQEAAALASRAISTSERDGVVVLSEFAEIIACRANRNERVRAAVISDRQQLELTARRLGLNLVCINPKPQTFVGLRNLLKDCSAMSPMVPAGWE